MTKTINKPSNQIATEMIFEDEKVAMEARFHNDSWAHRVNISHFHLLQERQTS